MTTELQEQNIIIKTLTVIVKRMLNLSDEEITITTVPSPFCVATLEYETCALIDDEIKVLHDISSTYAKPGNPSISCCIRPADTKGKLRVIIDVVFDDTEWEEMNKTVKRKVTEKDPRAGLICTRKS